MTLCGALAMFVLTPAPSAADGGPQPLDAHEWQVNTYTTSYQLRPRIAASPDGDFLVTWTSYGSWGDDDHPPSIQARRFRRDGSAIDSQELQVNTFTTGTQRSPDVAALADGDFVVVWESWMFQPDYDAIEIRSRRVGTSGEPLDPLELAVNVGTAGSQSRPSVAPLPDGAFVVVWEDRSSWIRSRRFRGDGTAIDTQDVQVNTRTWDLNLRPHVAAGPDGGYVVAWMSGDDSFAGIWGRRFGPDAEPLDAVEFLVNTYTPDMQFNPRVAVDPDGDFVVAWTSYLSPEDADGYAVRARRFARDGTPRDASDFQVNTFTTRQQAAYDVRTDAAGGFIVTWFSSHIEGLDSTVVARRLREDGSSIDAAEFELPASEFGSKGSPALARSPDGDFAAAWRGGPSPGDDEDQSIQMRRFGRPTIRVTDGGGTDPELPCLLVDAITAANTGVAAGGCPPGNEGAILDLPAGARLRYSAAAEGDNALPVVRSSVTIRGHGARLERDSAIPCPGAPNLRLFEVADGGILTLEDVELAGGCTTGSGGAIFANGGTVILKNARLTGHRADGDGGAVAVVDGGLDVDGSIVEGNVAGGAGGAFSVTGGPGALRVERSSLVANTAATGGAVSVAASRLGVVLQSTLVDNLASGAGGAVRLDHPAARLDLDHATVTGGSSGVHVASGALRLHGTVLGESGGADCSATGGALVATGANLDTDGSCAALAGSAVATVPSFGLAPLADNDGPTPTRFPFEGSPVLDGDPPCRTAAGAPLTEDQRGFHRPSDDDGDGEPACDLGAVERGPVFLDGFESGSTARWSAAQASSAKASAAAARPPSSSSSGTAKETRR
jgi:hypothetical protein